MGLATDEWIDTETNCPGTCHTARIMLVSVITGLSEKKKRQGDILLIYRYKGDMTKRKS